MLSAPNRHRRFPGLLALPLCALSGCDGGATLLVAFLSSVMIAALFVGRGRKRQSMLEARTLQRAIATGHHRTIEAKLRRELAAAAIGEGISDDRQWLVRTQLGGLLVAEWRLDEAAEVYSNHTGEISSHLQALAAFGHHELAVLSATPTDDTLAAIQRDRESCVRYVPASYRPTVTRSWDALEGLCLVRMGRPGDAIPLLERGLDAMGYNPAKIVYLFHLGQALEQLGDHIRAATCYAEATRAFPGTRLASEASARYSSLRASPQDGSFRRMLPESPATAPDRVSPRRTS